MGSKCHMDTAFNFGGMEKIREIYVQYIRCIVFFQRLSLRLCSIETIDANPNVLILAADVMLKNNGHIMC